MQVFGIATGCAVTGILLVLGFTLSRFADWLFYRRRWTPPLLVIILVRCGLCFLRFVLSDDYRWHIRAPMATHVTYLLSSLVRVYASPLAPLFCLGMCGNRLDRRRKTHAKAIDCRGSFTLSALFTRKRVQ